MHCPAGKRWSTACAYLHPALSRPNLTAEARTLVSRVLFEGTRAVGVEYIKNGQSHRVSELSPGVCSSHGREGTGSDPVVVLIVDRSHALVPISTVGKDCPQGLSGSSSLAEVRKPQSIHLQRAHDTLA